MTHRPDIDGLRAIAVLLVVIYHIGNSVGFHGFMGVDIFFVISGYLISGIIFEELSKGTFSLSRFYERRIRRIFPALLAVVCASTIVAAAILLPTELLAFSKSTTASIFFSSNFLFYSEAGYFDKSAELKPLLHTWSLAVEGQYYLLFPILMLGVFRWSKSRVKGFILLLFFLSLVFSLTFPVLIHDNSFAFYMLPVRAWELLAGACLALGIIPSWRGSDKKLNIVSAAGLVLILLAIFIEISETIPYSLYLVPVIAGTCMIIYAGQSSQSVVLNRVLGTRAPVFFGKISYSLYLWHWPIYIFCLYYSIGRLNDLERTALIFLSIILSYFSWRYIEQPFRNKKMKLTSLPNIASGLCAILAVVIISTAFILSNGVAPWHNKQEIQVANVSFGQKFDRFKMVDGRKDWYFGALGDPNSASIALIGDSHAWAVAPAVDKIAKEKSETAVMFSDTCLALTDPTNESEFFKQCSKQTSQTVKNVQHYPEIKTIILAQRWASKTRLWHENLDEGKDNYVELRQTALMKLIKALEKPGRTILVLAQVPLVPKRVDNIPSTYVRMKAKNHADLPSLFPTVHSYESNQKDVIPLLKNIQNLTDAQVVWPHKAFCKHDQCEIFDKDGFYYWDDDHLSTYGANKLSDMFLEYL